MCYVEMDGYGLNMWKVWIFQDVHFSHEFLYYCLENINSMGNWNKVPIIVDIFMISCVLDGIEKVVWSEQQLGVAGHTQDQGRCLTPQILKFLTIA
jgi:hypothetical protein